MTDIIKNIRRESDNLYSYASQILKEARTKIAATILKYMRLFYNTLLIRHSLHDELS